MRDNENQHNTPINQQQHNYYCHQPNPSVFLGHVVRPLQWRKTEVQCCLRQIGRRLFGARASGKAMFIYSSLPSRRQAVLWILSDCWRTPQRAVFLLGGIVCVCGEGTVPWSEIRRASRASPTTHQSKTTPKEWMPKNCPRSSAVHENGTLISYYCNTKTNPRV